MEWNVEELLENKDELVAGIQVKLCLSTTFIWVYDNERQSWPSG